MAKHLSNQGCEVEVVCPKWSGSIPMENHYFKLTHTHKPEHKQIEENRKKKYHIIKEFILYKLLKYNHIRDSKKGVFYKKFTTLNLDYTSYEVMITSYGPTDVLHIGDFVKTINPKILWCIDYRDYFSLNYYNNFGILRIFLKFFEKKITKKSDLFITVSNTLRLNIEKLINKRGFTIYNSFDSSTHSNLPIENIDSEVAQPPSYLYHNGSLYKGKRDVGPFLRFFTSRKLENKYCLIFALIDFEDEEYLKNQLSKYKVTNYRIYRNLNYDKSITFLKHAHAAILFSDFSRKSNGFLTGKLFEFMAYKKPIVYSGNTEKYYELYGIIKSHKLGESFEYFDYENREEAYIYNPDDLPYTRIKQFTNLYNILRNEIAHIKK